MRRIARILAVAEIIGFMLCTEAFAASVDKTPGNKTAVDKTAGSKTAAEEKTALAPPAYAYIFNGKLYWGDQAENIGVRVDFLPEPSIDEVSAVGGEQGEVFSGEADTVIIKTGNDPVDVAKFIRDVSCPYFRVRRIPEYNQHLTVTASEWLEPADNTVERLKGLGLSGWICLPGRWYFFEGGEPHKGWLELDRKEYYMDPDTGVMQYGWFSKNEKWYYFQEGTGELFTDGMTPDGFEVDKAGAWTGRCADGRTFYLDIQ